jgi:NADH-quinone oxidoreductase subunit G
MRDLGSHNVDHRTLQADFALDGELSKSSWLGMSVEALSQLKSVLVVGSALRAEHPLIAVRLRRQAAKGAQVNLVNSFRDDLAMPVANQLVAAPSQLPALLAQVLSAAHTLKGQAVPADVAALAGSVSDTARTIAQSLQQAPAGILLGNMAQHHPQWSTLYKLAQGISRVLEVPFGVLGEAANSVGAQLAGAIPHRGALGVPVQSGLNARAMLETPRKAYVVMGLEQDDFADPAAALAALKSADFVVALSAFRGEIPQWASVVLPIATLGETAGSTINMEGRLQSFQGALPPAGEARPGWKVLRVLGNLLNLEGFDYESADAVKNQLVQEGEAALKTLLGNEANGSIGAGRSAFGGVERIAPRSAYHTDALVRRAVSLQNTRLGREAVVQMPAALASSLGLSCGDGVRVRAGNQAVELTLKVVAGIPEGCVSIPAAHPLTSGLPLAANTVSLERL